MRKDVFVTHCSDPSRADQPAKYKIAAEWVGGGFAELKTYGFADDECLKRVYQQAQKRIRDFPPSSEESVSKLKIFEIAGGSLIPRPDLEQNCELS